MFRNEIQNSQNNYISQWETEDVLKWLKLINMSTYINTFESNKISGYDLCYFTNENLENDLRITRLHDRNLILKEIRTLIYEQLVLHLKYGDIIYGIQLDFDPNFTLEKITLLIQELFNIGESKFFFQYADKTNILTSSCKIVNMILMNPKEFKQINIIKDLRYSQINIPLSNDKLNSNDWGKIQSKLNDENWENKTPKLNKISQDKWENRTPILNKTNEKKIENTTPILFKTNEEKYEWEKRKSKKSIEEKAYIGKEEKEITFLNRDETLTLNNSQENNFKPFITKEKLGYIQIDNSNSNKNNNENDILNESTNTISMKNKMIERTNNYFNNLSTKVSFKSEYAKTLLNEKNLNHSINYDTKQVNKYTSETRFNREFDKENWNPDSSSKSSNNNLNESVIINDEKERSDFIIKIYNAKMKEEDSYKLNKADSSIVNEKEKENDKGSILNSYRNNNYSLHKIIGGNNYNLNYSKK